MYLIDTNHCSLAILGNINIFSRLAEVENSLVSTCVIVEGELIDMVTRSQKQQSNLALVQNFHPTFYRVCWVSQSLNPTYECS
jgi:tRNA(fMet)-specific endonuclease VapC